MLREKSNAYRERKISAYQDIEPTRPLHSRSGEILRMCHADLPVRLGKFFGPQRIEVKGLDNESVMS